MKVSDKLEVLTQVIFSKSAVNNIQELLILRSEETQGQEEALASAVRDVKLRGHLRRVLYHVS